MDTLFINKVTSNQAAFDKKVKDIAYKLGVDADWLMFIMNYETGGSFSPSITNDINAVGLIQFLPKTAAGLGTSTDALSKMSNVDQLDYVYDYLKAYRGDMVDYYTTYLAVFYPAALGQPDTYQFPSVDVNDNPSFFKTGNTMADFKKGLDNIVYAQVPTDYYDEFLGGKKKTILQVYQREIVIGAIILILIIALWLVVRQIIKSK